MPERNDKTQHRADIVSGMMTMDKGWQLAMLIPAGLLVGWLIGTGLDHWLHTSWVWIAGLIFGAVAGFVQMIRVAMGMMK